MMGPMTVFDGTGTKSGTLMPGKGTDQPMVCDLQAADLDGTGTDTILIAGRTMLSGDTTVIALQADGTRRWAFTSGKSSVRHEVRMAIGRFAPSGRQVAVSSEDGTITILDASGKVLGTQALGKRIAGICTLPGAPGKPDRIVVATTDAYTCYAWQGSGK
jgi:hypothetical protein